MKHRFSDFLGRAGLAFVLSAALSVPAAASIDLPDDPAAKGKAIGEETEARDLGFQDTEAEMRMILSNAFGDTSERELRMSTLERQGEEVGDWSRIVFDEPKDVEGTALLTHARILDPDDQWMFLPKLKRVKRISSANKSGPFMGSEFAFEDFSAQEPGKYDHLWLRDEACPDPVADRICHVTERRPLYENSGYTRQHVWTDTVDYQPRKIDYYDRKDSLLKTLLMTDYRLYGEKHWRAHDLFMENHQTKKNTRLTWSGFDFKTGLDENEFNKASLSRAR